MNSNVGTRSATGDTQELDWASVLGIDLRSRPVSPGTNAFEPVSAPAVAATVVTPASEIVAVDGEGATFSPRESPKSTTTEEGGDTATAQLMSFPPTPQPTSPADVGPFLFPLPTPVVGAAVVGSPPPLAADPESERQQTVLDSDITIDLEPTMDVVASETAIDATSVRPSSVLGAAEDGRVPARRESAVVPPQPSAMARIRASAPAPLDAGAVDDASRLGGAVSRVGRYSADPYRRSSLPPLERRETLAYEQSTHTPPSHTGTPEAGGGRFVGFIRSPGRSPARTPNRTPPRSPVGLSLDGPTDLHHSEFAGAVVMVTEVLSGSYNSFAAADAAATERDEDEEYAARGLPSPRTAAGALTTARGFDTSVVHLHVGDAVQIRWWFSNRVFETTSDYVTPIANGHGAGPKREAVTSGDSCVPNGFLLHVFSRVGKFYFATETNKGMRLRVRVTRKTTKLTRSVVLAALATVAVGTLLGVGILFLTLWAQQQSFLLPENKKETDTASYEGQKELRDIFLRHGLPWYAVGALFILGIFIGWIYACCSKQLLRSFGRGFSLWQQRRIQGTALVLIVTLLFLSLSMWFIVLETNLGFSHVFSVMSRAVTENMSEMLSVVQNVRLLIKELPTFLPSFHVSSSAVALLAEVEDLAVTVKEWSINGEDIARGVFRIFTVLMFAALQLVLYAQALSFAACSQRRPTIARSSVWFVLYALTLAAFATGTCALVGEFMQRSYDAGVLFDRRELTSGSLQTFTGVSKDSSLLKLVGVCLADGRLELSFLSGALTSGVRQFNRELMNDPNMAAYQLSDETLEGVTLAMLKNYSDFLTMQLTALDEVVTNDPDALRHTSPTLANATLPILRATLSVAKGVISMIDCKVVRQAIGEAIPALKDGVLGQLRDQLGLWIAVFTLLVILGVVMSIATWMFARPYKTWHDARTGRWFLFRWSLRAHRARIAANGLPSRNEVWKPASFCQDKYGFLLEVHRANVVNGFMLVLQAILLIGIDKTGNSSTRLDRHLRWAAFCLLLSPLFNIPASLDTFSDLRARFLVRFFSVALSVVAAVLSFEALSVASQDASNCYDLMTHSRGNTTVYRVDDECSIDAVFRGLEVSVYALVVGTVCAVSAATGLVLLRFVRIVLTMRYDILQSRRNDGLRSRRSFRCAACAITTVFIGAVGLGFLSLFSSAIGQPSAVSTTSFLLPRVGCNGYPQLCSKRVTEITWLGAHNAMSSVDDKFIGPNHYFGISVQLRAGIRVFLLDALNTTDVAGKQSSANVAPSDIIAGNGSQPLTNVTSAVPVSPDTLKTNSTRNATVPIPSFCHMSCGLGSVSMAKVFRLFAEFLRANRTDVIIIVIEQYVLSEVIWKELDSAGLASLVWSPLTSPASDTAFEWPTLQSLIQDDKRLLIFSELRQPNSLNSPPQGRTLLPFFDFAFETNFAASRASQLTCAPMRGKPAIPAEGQRKLASMNNFLTAPLAQPTLANEVNDKSFLVARWQSCASAWGRIPTFVVVDFWSLKDPLSTIAALNGQAS